MIVLEVYKNTYIRDYVYGAIQCSEYSTCDDSINANHYCKARANNHDKCLFQIVLPNKDLELLKSEPKKWALLHSQSTIHGKNSFIKLIYQGKITSDNIIIPKIRNKKYGRI